VEPNKVTENTNLVTLFARHATIKVIIARHVEEILETLRVRRKEKRMTLGVNETRECRQHKFPSIIKG